MILVCDRTGSSRAAKIRETLYSAGCPAAFGEISDYRNARPARLIVTFTDVLDAVRQTPLDDLYAIALGDGFVNSALNAERLTDSSRLTETVKRRLLTQAEIEGKRITAFGVFGHPGVFFAKDFFEVCGNRIVPTKAEYMIFKYLMSDIDSGRCIPPEQIQRYCYPSNKLDDESAAIAVHISNLNRKAEEACGYHIIESVRYQGYRAVIR
ncbi:MAG: helix-turn-helix domain-containing protein [Clostridia bacterium]|nr:helix-turn-helix domain-containing protein [Clostridia bacterium]MBQ8370798.1 helix-turn-helix domain-containing protein [Clostridia bacterium]